MKTLDRKLGKRIKDAALIALGVNPKAAYQYVELGLRNSVNGDETFNSLLWPEDSDLADGPLNVMKPHEWRSAIRDVEEKDGVIVLDCYCYLVTPDNRPKDYWEFEMINVNVIIKDGEVMGRAPVYNFD